MPWRADPQPSAARWHAIGCTAFLIMLAMYAAAAAYFATANVEHGLYWLIVGLGALGVIAGLVGWSRGWQRLRGPLIGWPIVSLVATILVGAVDPTATREVPGTITLVFSFVGLTCAPWSSLAILPLGLAALIVGGDMDLPRLLPIVVATGVMWVLVAEIPAGLIARLRKQTALLLKVAQTDALTQLLDRSTLLPRLSTHANGSALVLIDLDNFKLYNDDHGHHAGDELLVAFADALRSVVRQEDLVFRIGGDEFLLLLVRTSPTEARQVLEQLRHRWAEANEPVGFSAGIAVGEEHLLRLADEHMYADKRSRRRYTE